MDPPNKDVIEKNVSSKESSDWVWIAIIISIIVGILLFSYYPHISALISCIFVSFIVFCILFALGSKHDSAAISPKVEQQYQLAMNEYYAALQQDQNRVEHEKRQMELIQLRINNIEAQKNQTMRILEKMYDIGILYPKYQALIPIVMFCEYFESGRCAQLEGHEGAYNIYESELRQNIIIAKLDDISGKLEQIKQNQYMLYEAIQENNQRVNQLCNATYDSARRLEDLQRNTAITAENSRVAAQNTRIIGEIEAYKLLRS